jgi:hypothetical protein
MAGINFTLSGDSSAPSMHLPLVAQSIEHIRTVARAAGRRAFNDIDTIESCWVIARSAWLDAHIPGGPAGMSDDEFNVIASEAADAYEEGIDELYRSLEESVSHE